LASRRMTHLNAQQSAALLHSRVMSHINRCADDCVLTKKEDQIDCDFCLVRTQCLDYWDYFIAASSNFSLSTHLRRLDSFRRQKLIAALILVLTSLERGLMCVTR